MLQTGAERRTFLKPVMDVTTGLSGTRNPAGSRRLSSCSDNSVGTTANSGTAVAAQA